MNLQQLLEDVKNTSGIKQKTEIQSIAHALKHARANPDYPNGDDAAVVKRDDGGYDLLVGEGFLSEFVETDPWFAGWCGVMVNVSDIVAMGGRPCAITNTLWSNDSEQCAHIFNGMSEASKVFNVPIVGGHTNLRSSNSQLAVSIFGRANALLSSFNARPGDALVTAIDLRGEFRAPFLNWNAATTAPIERLRGDIELLPTIAEQQLAHSAKDISQAGLLGTSLMLFESSHVGATINLENIPKPEHVAWLDWLCCFPSFGYLLTTPMNKLDQLLESFDERNISAAQIGQITAEPLVQISYQNQTECFWDIATTPVTGMTPTAQTSTPKQITTPKEASYA